MDIPANATLTPQPIIGMRSAASSLIHLAWHRTESMPMKQCSRHWNAAQAARWERARMGCQFSYNELFGSQHGKRMDIGA